MRVSERERVVVWLGEVSQSPGEPRRRERVRGCGGEGQGREAPEATEPCRWELACDGYAHAALIPRSTNASC